MASERLAGAIAESDVIPHDKPTTPGGQEGDLGARLVAARFAQNAAQSAEGRNAFLAKASLALGRSLDLQTTSDTAARLPIPQFAVAALIDIRRDDGSIRRISVAHEVEERERRLRKLAEEFVMHAASPQMAVFETGSPQLGQIDDEEVPLYATSAEEAKLLADLHCRAYLALPLGTRGAVFGCMTLLSTGRHTYGVNEFTTASEYARRASLAIDHALLYREAVRARAAAEEAEAQFRSLVNGFRESEDRYRAIFQDSHDAIYVTRLDGQFVDANPAALTMLGYTRDELLRENARILYVDVEERERFRAVIEGSGTVRDFQLQLRRKDGTKINCLLSSMVRRGTNGEITGYQGIIHDVTERIESEIRLLASQHFTQTIITSVQQGIIVYDSELRYQVFNKFMEDLTGVSAAEIIGQFPGEVFPHLVDNGVDKLLRRALEGETVHAVDMPYVDKQTGQHGWTSAVYSPHISPDGKIMGVVGIVVDITERKRAEDQLTHNAFHDALTGLPNRALFVDRLERLMRHSERNPSSKFAVAFLDLDRFKVVNDSLGHLIGDQLLVSIGERLAGCLRTGDTVARLGGDEFALLLDNINEVQDATRVAERVCADLEKPFMLADQEVFTNVSIGIAMSESGYTKTDDMLRDADTAMYRAKVDGRCRYEVFDRNMDEKATHVLQLETDLRRAVDRNEFLLYYQPIISLADGKITGFEALIRWKHPKRGIVPPDEFIPLAEETGLIVPIGWWVLEEACHQMGRWHARFNPPTPLSVSVNLSAKQFLQSDLVPRLDDVLQRTGMDPHRLQLEITESVVIRNETSVAATLEALRARGIQLCLDDFGTGYSSLSYLHAFPIDTLKIDRSFVGQIDTKNETPGIVETIVALSRNLGMHAVAEGVETKEQLAFLRGIGPQFAQGYFFSAALAPDQIEEMLTRNPVW